MAKIEKATERLMISRRLNWKQEEIVRLDMTLCLAKESELPRVTFNDSNPGQLTRTG